VRIDITASLYTDLFYHYLAYIKDDTATLTSSGIHDGCIVYVMGDRANVRSFVVGEYAGLHSPSM